jgi:release factor glutamine methyltransferase
MTIREALNIQHRTVSLRDAEVLLAATLKYNRTYLHAHPDEALSSTQALHFESSLRRREQNEPVAYITGEKEFYGRTFLADKRALIPRPETEGVVEQAVTWSETFFKTHLAASNKPCPVHILELGTGGGVIAISLALELAARNVPATILATDIAPEAVALAEENWGRLKGSSSSLIKLSFVTADLFEHPLITDHTFDLIVANLPYVETTWQVETGAQPDVVFFEPDIALFGGQDGLDIYRQFFTEAPSHLVANGAVMIEYGDTQTTAITPLAQAAFPTKKFQVHQDYAQLDRVITLT